MNDAHGYPIMWSEPNLNGTTPAWDGPAPDAAAAEPAAANTTNGGFSSLSNAWNMSSHDSQASQPASAPESGEPVGWAGNGAGGQTASDYSAAQPQAQGYGWNPGQAGPTFSAPDAPPAPDAAPASNRYETNPPAPSADGGSHAINPDRGPHHTAPVSYTSAPPSEFGTGAANAPGAPFEQHAPTQDEFQQQPHAAGQRGPGEYESLPASAPAGQYTSAPSEPERPEVVGNNDNLDDDSLTIGRSRDNSIVLDDMLVSRRHVVITADDEGLLLRDVGSRNGTFVNGRRVEQIHLQEGDRIGIGASTFEVRDGWLVSL